MKNDNTIGKKPQSQKGFRSLLAGLALCATGITAGAVEDVCDAFGPLSTPTSDLRGDAVVEGELRHHNFGFSTANLGDFNGDGFEDLAIGAPGADLNGPRSGAVYVFYGPIGNVGALTPDDANLTLAGPDVFGNVGWSVASAGDVDLDGRDDLLIGSLPSYRSTSPQGKAWLVLGSDDLPQTLALDGLQPSEGAVFHGPAGTTEFGSVVAGAGDVDGDGFSDVAIGAPLDNTAGTQAGAVYVFSGAPLGVVTAAEADLTYYGPAARARAGASVAGVGDLDADGFDDLVVGAPRDNTFARNAGAAFVLYGDPVLSGAHNVLEAGTTLYGNERDRLGAAAAAAGDVNHDGYADFWVTATQYASFRRGAAYLMLGGEHLGVQVADDAFHGRFLGRDANDSFGSALAASDFNGDGWADVVVGAERSDNGTRSTGGAWALHGPFDAPFDTIVGPGDGMIGGTQYLSFTGSAVAAFDDLNGDGFGDVVVGGWRNTIGGLSGVGRVSLHLGGQDIADATPWYADADGDGYGDGDNGPLSCFPLEGRTQRSGDCDDSDGATYPYAPELSCTELVDRNCDGLVGPVDQDGDGMTACGGDCDDRDLGVHPGAFERCNDGIDNDCANGVDDDGAVDAVTWYADSDGDGYGSVTAHFTTCEVPSFFLTPPVTVGGDCNDASAAVSPARPEVCDALDNDCDGVVDGSNSLDARQYFADGDGDGFGDRFAPLMACALPVGFALDHSDCDDGDAMAMPGGVEVCDFADNDCDGRFYLGGPVGEARAEQRFLAPSVGTGFADRVAMMPDTDGDGLAELVFTAPEDAALVRSGGSVLVRFGRDHMGTVDLAQVRADGSTTWDARIRTDRARSSLGASVASGDFNGDGFSDLAVGAPGMARPSTAQGAVFVFYGPVYGDLDAEMADVVFSGVDAGSRLGSALVGGDLDGDGFDDLVLTATDEHGPGVKRGAAHVLYGAEAWTSGRIDAVREAVLYGTLDGLELGDAAAMVGDLNGDGAADLAVSASNDGALKFGRVDLVMGTGSRLQGALVADVTLVGAGTGQRLGVDLAGAGDVNGDGLGDLLIGTSRNVAYLVLGGTLNGGASAIAGAADVTFTGDGSSFGLRVGAAGDLNGDGLSDMLIGAHSDDDGGRNAGSAYVVYGAAQMPATVHETQIDSVGRRPVASDLLPGDSRPVESLPSFSFKHVGGVEGAKLVGSTESGRFGYAVGGGYDVNGDGFDDVLVGSTGGIGVVAGASVYYAGPYGMDALAQTEVSFSRSLVVDGERADWLPVQQLETSAGGRASAAVSWDADNLYVGFESVDVLTGGHEHLVVAYFGAGGATSTRSGLALGSQQPTLPFDATHALVWSVDGSTSALATFDGEGWVLDETWTAYGDVVASGEVVEFRLPRTAVGSPTTLEFAAWWVFTGGVGEQSMAAVPANAFEDASYDPNPGHWFRFVLTGAMGPASSPTMPSEQGLGIDALAASMTRYIWDRDVDGRSDDTLAGFDSCPLHLPYRFPQPLDPTLDDDIRPLGIADVSRAVDCDDQDPARYGGAPEIEGDGIDSDCDGFDGFDIEAIAHVSLAEGVLFTDQVAVASAWATDPDAGTDLERPVEYRYTWKVDGVVVPVSGPTLDGAQWFSKGQTVQVAVTVWDGAQISAPVYATAVVVNSLSTTTACDIAPVGETSYDLPISMSSATLDRDSDAVTVSVDWSGAPTVHHFDGHNTIDAFMTGRNSFVWGVCRPHDGERRGYSKFSEAVFVHGPDAEPFEPATGPDTQPPIVLAVEISPKDPREGIDDLEMDAVGWDWERNLATFEYRWYVGNTSTPTHFGKRLPRSAWRPNMYVAGEVRALDEAGNPGPWVRVLATFPSVNHAPHVGGITFFPDRVHALNDITVNTYGGDSDGDTVRNTYEWAVNGVVINGFNHDRLPASYVRDGDMVTVAVTPNDGTEDGDTVAGTIMVDNSQFAPVVTSLTITPVTATEDDDLSVVADVSDPNGDPVTVTFTWSVNGVPVHTGPTLSRIFYTADDVVRVTAQVHDGLLPGHPVSQELVILRVNQPPVIDAIRIDPGTPYVENDLTAVVEAHDPDGDNIFLTYTWRVDGVVLHDVRTDRLPHHRTRNLSEVEVTAVADDGFESSLPATADTTVVNRPPVVTRAVLDPNPAFVDEDIFADVRVTDPDGDPVEVEYVWVVDGLVQHGVTGDTLPASATEVGSSVTVRVTPHDGIVTGAQVTAVAVVANRPPTATVTLMPASPYTTDNLVASSTTADPDGDDVTVRYTWEVDGVVVPGVTGNTLPAAFTRNESRVRVTVTPNDGRMDGTPASTFRDVVNRLPIAMVTLSPTSPTSSDPIVATVSTSDADADPVTLRYRWTVDGAVIFAATTHTLPAAYTRSMSAVEVRVIPNDSYDDGLPVFATTQVGNRPPVVDSVVINPTSPNMDDNLRATATATDPDGDPVTFTFVWTVDGVVVPGVTGRDLPASHTNARSHVVAVATPHDGHEFGREGQRCHRHRQPQAPDHLPRPEPGRAPGHRKRGRDLDRSRPGRRPRDRALPVGHQRPDRALHRARPCPPSTPRRGDNVRVIATPQ
jgi:hypothetical protein